LIMEKWEVRKKIQRARRRKTSTWIMPSSWGRIPFEGSACRTHLVAFLVPLWLPVIYPVGDLPGLPVISISRIRRATYDEPRQLKSTGRPACLTTFSPWILDWNHAWK
jgi:hypothetical protein